MAKNTSNKGVRWLFSSTAFHYQAIRTMGHSIYHGALPGEVLSAISQIRDEDTESWFDNWQRMAKHCELLADKACDNISGGNALLRASNYYRTSEFFLEPSDKRKRETYNKSVETFQLALETLGIKYEIWYVPYETGEMRTYYFPGDEDKPLIITCGGYDSTNEESYFWIGCAAIQRGYPLIMFEGPGQSNMIREYGIRFTPDWQKPVSKIIDFIENKETVPSFRKKILFGISLGGLLAIGGSGSCI
ncbi:MAG: hypothetical protein ABSB79_06875 [Syntrophales bacterium]|jgi:hypothetical protein